MVPPQRGELVKATVLRDRVLEMRRSSPFRKPIRALVPTQVPSSRVRYVFDVVNRSAPLHNASLVFYGASSFDSSSTMAVVAADMPYLAMRPLVLIILGLIETTGLQARFRCTYS